LLAEDNAVNRKLALKLLERMGYTADVACDGVEAVAAVGEGTYDLVLMDVQMPEMDGLEATRSIIERYGPARPRIVALTADAMLVDRKRCLDAGMDDYVTKPIRPAELVEALERATRRPAAPLDAESLDRLMETAGGDPEFVADLLDSFAADALVMLGELRSTVASGDNESVRRAAHTLKANAATFGATELAAICAELEASARNADLVHGGRTLTRIQESYDDVRLQLEALRQRLVAH
jgi:CheY-like chemotaxis protein/HPt (histidine-containing phosphotransfer) domain-containing protein